MNESEQTAKWLNVAIGVVVAAIIAASGYLIYSTYFAVDTGSVHEIDLANWKEAVKNNPDDALVHANLAASYGDVDEWDNAVEEYRKAIELAPDDYVFMFRLGVAYRHISEFNDAITQLSQAAELAPVGEKYAALYQIADIYYERGDLSLAKESAIKSIEDNEVIWNTHFLLGNIYLDEGDTEKAREELEIADKYNSGAPEIQEALNKLS